MNYSIFKFYGMSAKNYGGNQTLMRQAHIDTHQSHLFWSYDVGVDVLRHKHVFHEKDTAENDDEEPTLKWTGPVYSWSPKQGSYSQSPSSVARQPVIQRPGGLKS